MEPNRQRKRTPKKSVNFTDKFIKSLKPESEMYQIREGRGFAIRVLPSGVKTWYYIYTFLGKRRQLNLGNYPYISLEKAHKDYLDAATMVHNGIDPMQPPSPAATPDEQKPITVVELKKLYMEHVKINLVPRSALNHHYRMEKDLIPAWGDRPITDIRRRDAIALIESIAAQGKPGAARNLLISSRAMFSYAVHREMIEYNPFAGVGVAVPQAAAKERDRVLSEGEIKHVWNTLSNWGNSEYIRRAILFILVTGQRPGEVSQMHWREIDGRVWTIPSDRSKNGRENRVYLSDLALSLLPDTEGYVFPANRGNHGSMFVNTLSHHLSHHVKPAYLGLPRWTPHDLRRTAATGLASIGCPDEIIDEIQNHKKRGIIRTYNRYRYDKEKQEWLTRWSQQLENLL